MIFGAALEALINGSKVRRKRWDKNLLLFAEASKMEALRISFAPAFSPSAVATFCLDDFTAGDWEIYVPRPQKAEPPAPPPAIPTSDNPAAIVDLSGKPKAGA